MVPSAERFVQDNPVEGTVRTETLTKGDVEIQQSAGMFPPLRQKSTDPFFETYGP